jgi:capsular polysaccharide biosynthesis protein
VYHLYDITSLVCALPKNFLLMLIVVIFVLCDSVWLFECALPGYISQIILLLGYLGPLFVWAVLWVLGSF